MDLNRCFPYRFSSYSPRNYCGSEPLRAGRPWPGPVYPICHGRRAEYSD